MGELPTFRFTWIPRKRNEAANLISKMTAAENLPSNQLKTYTPLDAVKIWGRRMVDFFKIEWGGNWGENGYWWILYVWKFWNSRNVPEAQRLQEAHHGLSDKALQCYWLWRFRNPRATWDTFEVAFLQRYKPEFIRVLPEIDQNEVSDLDLQYVEPIATIDLTIPEADLSTTDLEISKGEKTTYPDPGFGIDEHSENKELTDDTVSDDDGWVHDSNKEGSGDVDGARSNAKVSIDLVIRGDTSVVMEMMNVTPLDLKRDISGNWRKDRNDVEDVAVVKRKVEPPDLEATDVDASWISSDQSRGSGAIDSQKSGGGLLHIFPTMARPPALLASILPWDRVDETGTEKQQDEVMVKDVDRAIVDAVVYDRDSEIHAESSVVDVHRRGTIRDGGNTSAMKLATMPTSSLTQVMVSATKGGPLVEQRFRIELPSVNLVEACVAAETIEVSIVDESTLFLPTTRNDDSDKREEVGIDMSNNSGSNKLKARVERTHSHANEI
ncbi:hypothetical protein PIB30_006111 [Stylosanthes scabra]|uniref:RNase H type-1 domain-containing protein n=1 Tax=Stylosanthes scabra TaxID=79078 RepID=A0ABU6W3R0_9FABA|nr:hypothetical protein [Stylosanthes scabra]